LLINLAVFGWENRHGKCALEVSLETTVWIALPRSMSYERALTIRSTAVTDSLDPGSFRFNLMHLNTQVSLVLIVQLISVVAHRVSSGSYGGLSFLYAISYLPPLRVMTSEEQNKRFSTRYNSHHTL